MPTNIFSPCTIMGTWNGRYGINDVVWPTAVVDNGPCLSRTGTTAVRCWMADKHTRCTDRCSGFPFCSQAAQGAVRLEGDVITAHGSVSSLPMGTFAAVSGRGRGSSPPADNASVCTCTCTRSRSRNDGGYRVTGSPSYASGSVYDGGGNDDVDDADDGDDADDRDESRDIQLDTFYLHAASPTDGHQPPDNCRQRVVQMRHHHHRSSI